MTPNKHPVTTDVVLVGAGHAHVAVLRMAAMKPVPGVRYTLVTREVHTPYSGMLPGLVAGIYGFDDAHIDTGPLCRMAGARLFGDEAIGIDLAGRRVICRDRPPVPFDLLSLDIGSSPNTGDIPGADQHAIAVKPIDRFLAAFEALRARVLAAGGARRFAMVGGGAGGVELLLAVQARLRQDVAVAGLDPNRLSFTLVSRGDDILEAFPESFRRKVAGVLKERGISVRTGAAVAAVSTGAVTLSSGETLAADDVLWTTQAAAPAWLRETGLALDERGFVRVGPTLESVSHPGVFAAGDIAAFEARSLPKSGVYAVRAGPVLAGNLRRAAAGKAGAPFRPQREAMYLLATADGRAVGSRNGFTFAGRWVWRWKNRIDRKFMDRFNNLPQMPERESTTDGAFAMRCGGCGAKVGASVLTGALADLRPHRRPEIVLGLDAPDDAALLDRGGPELEIQTVDFFRAPVDDPWTFGRVAANHALSDVYAMGGEPVSALAIVTLPPASERALRADLGALMAGANAALAEAGCALVGGHTGEGAELALGFAVTGSLARGRALAKAGARPGDALVLTKALGTGALLAADMRGRAKARHVQAALAQMTHSNAQAARILCAHAHALTDITGFGLVGHLGEMLRASGVGAELWPERVPALEGAREALAQGVASTLQPENLRQRTALHVPALAERNPLLFDPQTSGGLLAAMPAEAAAGCVEALRAAGYAAAAIIGRIGEPGAPLISLADDPPSGLVGGAELGRDG
ncbi:hypothetical protein GCM10007036_19390 [Alsobacter metallidurans]|uniref:Selenide, water dikinase n=1 Tax=Alsobacter metallidurans TaxID=340221 RepID=A0A917MHX6_9HYPH|nr:selenide, water dikinase SelD [Alsobacter metallidurans]GGH17724.1 hypothetical protein GCM10007036_19390 [Alsobacter metallidurans]